MVNIHSIPCPYGNRNAEVVIRDGIDPQEPRFSRGDVILDRLKSGPIIYAMCSLTLCVKDRVSYVREGKEESFEKIMTEYGCPLPIDKSLTGKGCMFNSGNWVALEALAIEP